MTRAIKKKVVSSDSVEKSMLSFQTRCWVAAEWVPVIVVWCLRSIPDNHTCPSPLLIPFHSDHSSMHELQHAVHCSFPSLTLPDVHKSSKPEYKKMMIGLQFKVKPSLGHCMLFRSLFITHLLYCSWQCGGYCKRYHILCMNPSVYTAKIQCKPGAARSESEGCRSQTAPVPSGQLQYEESVVRDQLRKKSSLTHLPSTRKMSKASSTAFKASTEINLYPLRLHTCKPHLHTELRDCV